MNSAEDRTAYIFSLMEKGERGEKLTKIEALIIVQYAFAGSIVQALPQLEADVERAPTEVSRENAKLLIEVARELVDEFAVLVDEHRREESPIIKLAGAKETSEVVNRALRKAFDR
jgi:hypothetical protein